MRIYRAIFFHTCAQAKLFVTNQNTLDALPEKMIKVLADETDSLLASESNKAIAAEIKAASASDLRNSDSRRLAHETANAKMRVAPTDADLATQIRHSEFQIVKLRGHLDPLRSGMPLVSSAKLDNFDVDWTHWRAEWILRRKVFQ